METYRTKAEKLTAEASAVAATVRHQDALDILFGTRTRPQQTSNQAVKKEWGAYNYEGQIRHMDMLTYWQVRLNRLFVRIFFLIYAKIDPQHSIPTNVCHGTGLHTYPSLSSPLRTCFLLRKGDSHSTTQPNRRGADGAAANAEIRI